MGYAEELNKQVSGHVVLAQLRIDELRRDLREHRRQEQEIKNDLARAIQHKRAMEGKS